MISRFDTPGADLAEKQDDIKSESLNFPGFSGEIPETLKPAIILTGVNRSIAAVPKIDGVS